MIKITQGFFFASSPSISLLPEVRVWRYVFPRVSSCLQKLMPECSILFTKIAQIGAEESNWLANCYWYCVCLYVWLIALELNCDLNCNLLVLCCCSFPFSVFCWKLRRRCLRTHSSLVFFRSFTASGMSSFLVLIFWKLFSFTTLNFRFNCFIYLF